LQKTYAQKKIKTISICDSNHKDEAMFEYGSWIKGGNTVHAFFQFKISVTAFGSTFGGTTVDCPKVAYGII
jgi:hypothetical protein